MSPTFFIGLVTHERTRFPEGRGPAGAAATLSSALQARHLSVAVSIHEADHHNVELLPLTSAEVQSSIDVELSLERRWSNYIDPRNRSRTRLLLALRRAYRRLQLNPPWHRSSDATPRGASMLRRLVNIEIAHLHLMEQALDSGAAWVLILEDDARLDDPEGFADWLVDFHQSRADVPQPLYVNASRSFDAGTLGVKAHLIEISRSATGLMVLAADRPLTNTVCAVLYRSNFLLDLKRQLDAIPLSPVLPIDWKINAALLGLHDQGDVGPGDCWFLEPAPFLQGSMRLIDG